MDGGQKVKEMLRAYFKQIHCNFLKWASPRIRQSADELLVKNKLMNKKTKILCGYLHLV